MSYILDALKKSEQERGHGNVPDVQTVHSSSLNYRSDKKAYWPYILIVAVLLNLAAIAYFIFDKNNPVEVAQTSAGDISQVRTAADETLIQRQSETSLLPASENIVEETGKPAPADSAVTSIELRPQEAALPEPVKPEPTIKKIPASSKTDVTPVPMLAVPGGHEDIIDFHELPESVKQQLPTITISAHVYSSNPLQRSIVINNNFMEEGEYVLDDLILHEITKDGAVFNYRGTLFNYGVVSGWQ